MLFVHENIKLLSEALLMNKNIFVHYEWFGKFIEDMYSSIYGKFLNIIKIKNLDVLLEKNQHIRGHFVKVLKKESFSDVNYN